MGASACSVLKPKDCDCPKFSQHSGQQFSPSVYYEEAPVPVPMHPLSDDPTVQL